MLGYVTTEKAELKLKEYEIYRGFYCGICKSISRRYGQVPRLVLSYDAAFLAALLNSVDGCEKKITHERCIAHMTQKKTMISAKAVDYAADVLIMLAYNKLMDDIDDDDSLKAKVAASLTERYYNKAKELHPELDYDIKHALVELWVYEHKEVPGIDRPAEAQAHLMEAIIEHYDIGESYKLVLKRIVSMLGRWIYLMDAWEDIEKDAKKGSYNPLLLQYGYSKEEGTLGLRKRIARDVNMLLMMYLAEMSKALDLLEITENEGIIKNIVNMGLLRRTERAMELADGMQCDERGCKPNKRKTQ